MIKTKVSFSKGRLLSSQSEQLKKYSKSSDWLEKSRPSKKPFLLWSCKQAKCKPAKYSLLMTTQLKCACNHSIGRSVKYSKTQVILAKIYKIIQLWCILIYCYSIALSCVNISFTL